MEPYLWARHPTKDGHISIWLEGGKTLTKRQVEWLIKFLELYAEMLAEEEAEQNRSPGYPR